MWQGTSGTSREVPAVGLESLSGLKKFVVKRIGRKGKKVRERESVFMYTTDVTC